MAYAFINVDGPTDNPGPYNHSAMFAVVLNVHFCVVPSFLRHMLLHFNYKVDRDRTTDLNPIIHEGARLTLV